MVWKRASHRRALSHREILPLGVKSLPGPQPWAALLGPFQPSYLFQLRLSVLVGDRSSPLGTQQEELFLDSVFSYSFQRDELSCSTARMREEQHVKYSSFWGQLRSKCLQGWEPRAAP